MEFYEISAVLAVLCLISCVGLHVEVTLPYNQNLGSKEQLSYLGFPLPMLISPIKSFSLAKQVEQRPPAMVVAHLVMVIGFLISTALVVAFR